jgi:hypothetical protein
VTSHQLVARAAISVDLPLPEQGLVAATLLDG